MIIFQGVSKIYKRGQHSSVALDNVSFKINKKEFISLVGKSGAGKSTIIKLLIGEEKPTKGRIVFGSYDVARLKSDELYKMRRHVGTIFQDFKLLPEKTAYENVAFALEAAARPQREIDSLAPKALDVVGLLHKSDSFPREMSGGEKQRVAIARAMVNNPDIIIADEPTGNLDPVNAADIIKLLLKINELGTTIILATHNKDVINHINRRVISLEDGQIVRDEEEGKYVLF
jgi:cell division transport system ATP-binding protein